MTSAPPTVAHVVLTRRLAGIERSVAELCCGLRREGWRTIIAAPGDLDQHLGTVYEAAAELHRLPNLPLPMLVAHLGRFVRREGVGILHGHGGTSTVLAIGAARATRRPVVGSFHFSVLRHSQGRVAWAAERAHWLAMRRLDAAIMVSRAVEAAMAPRLGPPGPRVRVVLNGLGCAVSDVPGRPVPAPSSPVVLYAGRFDHEKQVHLLIEAMALVPRPAVLWLAGRGILEPGLRALADRVVPGRVRFLGFREDIPDLLRQVSLLVLPSRDEPFGLVALEAMQAARPVVGFRAGGLREIVEEGVSGVLATPGDTADLAGAIRSLLADPILAARMGAAGRLRYERFFSATEMARQTAGIYAEVGAASAFQES